MDSNDFDPDTAKPKPVSSWIETANANDREVNNDEHEYDISILSSGMTQEGGKLLQQIFGTKTFAYPKPLSLVRSLIRASTRNDDFILDSFAGTGTSGHAVLDLNKEDSGNRQFILVEMDENICQTITAERLRRAVLGYTVDKNKGQKQKLEGLGGGFRFCRLGEPLFDEAGNIRDLLVSPIWPHISTLQKPVLHFPSGPRRSRHF